MNPCNIFSFWGHCKFVNANSKAKSKVEFAQCKQSENAKKEPCLRLLQVSNFQTFNNQDSRWKKNEWKMFNIPLESNPTPPNLKMNYSLLVEMPNPPQTAQNTCPISSSMLLFKNQCCSKTQKLRNDE
jgi:hypothetical protein